MERWGLGPLARQAYGDLSGGQKQRLMLALALVGDPEVVVLDELTTGLDPVARRETWRLVNDLRASGTTVVLVSHYFDETEALCDRLAILARGRVQATGTPAEIMAATGTGSLEEAYFALEGADR
ncbi:ATP-binding cassette domain-containing protein [Nonomuraea salmonea]